MKIPPITKNSIKNIAIVLLTIVLVVFIIISKYRASRIVNLKGENALLTQSIDSFKNERDQTVTEQQTAVFTNDNVLKEQSKEIFNLSRKNERLIKQVNALVQLKQQVRIDTAFIPYVDTVTKYITKNTDSLIQVPKLFSLNDTFFDIDGVVLKNGILIHNLYLDDSLSLRIADKSQGWFKPNISVVQVVNTNPHVNITGMTSAVVKTPQSEWQKWGKPLVAAIISSFITYQVVK